MRLLIAEDEVDLAEALTVFFEKKQFSVDAVNDGFSAYDYASMGEYDGIILDVMMPKMNGIEVLQKLRADGIKTPVMMLTAKGQKDDRITGFNAGADDYLVKPFSFKELQARIQAMLRRVGHAEPGGLRCGDLSLDAASHRAMRDGQPIELTLREYRLLECLMRHAGTAVSRGDLLRMVWEKEPDAHNTNVVDVYVNYLRQKVDKAFERKLIHTVTGVGYRMEA